jgi:hypothetical protein
MSVAAPNRKPGNARPFSGARTQKGPEKIRAFSRHALGCGVTERITSAIN